jgi:hypothetical protein
MTHTDCTTGVSTPVIEKKYESTGLGGGWYVVRVNGIRMSFGGSGRLTRKAAIRTVRELRHALGVSS